MFFKDVPKFLFPQKCFFCGKYGASICNICIKRVERLEKPCVKNLKNKNLDLLIYFFKYEKIIRKLMLQFKFSNKPYIAEVFLKIIVKNEKICGNLKFYDIIISVPMYRLKKLDRGYNQTELFSKHLADFLNVEYDPDVLAKIVDNKRQSSLSVEKRQENIRNVFKVLKKDSIKNKKVILVDDIYTSRCDNGRMRKDFKRRGRKFRIRLSYCKRLGDF